MQLEKTQSFVFQSYQIKSQIPLKKITSNGNASICSGTVGAFLAVTSTGEIVWKYICPV